MVIRQTNRLTQLNSQQLTNSPLIQQPHRINFPLFRPKLEPSRNIELNIKKYAMLILIDKSTYIFAIPVLRTNINIILFPISMYNNFNIFIYRCFNNKIYHMR